MKIDLIVFPHLTAVLEVRLDVIICQCGELLSEVRQLIDKLLGLHEIRSMQNAIIVEVEQSKHELSFDDWS